MPRRTESYNLLFRIGHVLSRHDDSLTMSRLSAALDIAPSTASRLVDWLEAGGFAERRTDPTDGRVIRVAQALTPEEAQILTLLLSKYLAAARQLL